MNDFKSEKIKELTDKIKELPEKTVSFKIFMDSEEKPWEYGKANKNVEKVLMLLEELRRGYGVNYEIKDTHMVNRDAAKTAYKLSAHWAMTTERRSFGARRMIYDIFVGGEAGDYFGKEIPAMIVYYPSNDILCVLPHVVKGETFSLAKFSLPQMGSETRTAIITIYDFLTALKEDLQKEE